MNSYEKVLTHYSHVCEEFEVSSVEEIIHTNSHNIVELTRALRMFEQPAVETDDDGNGTITDWNEGKKAVSNPGECGYEEESKDVEEPDE